jgi:hypothetical protein
MATLLALGLSHAGIPGQHIVAAAEVPQTEAAKNGKESGQEGAGQPADPTQISPQISELLEKLQPPSSPTTAPDGQNPAAASSKEEAQSEVAAIRLRGMIMRDSEQGTAILEVGKGQYVHVPLQRGNARIEPHQLSLDGQLFEIESFNPTSLTLKNIKSGQLRIIH